MSQNMKKEAPKLEAEIQQQLDQLPSVSAKFRYLASLDYSRGDIGRITGKRYQHVKNVLDKPLKK